MDRIIRIGTRESELAVWQATTVKNLLFQHHIESQLVYVKSEGDINQLTPLYEMGVQGIFTRTLDLALLNDRIDIAVHSMKDVPTLLPEGISKAAVLQRASYKDILVYKNDRVIEDWKLQDKLNEPHITSGIIATSSIRRKAQWLHRYPAHQIENLRGNVNTRLRKVGESNWDGAIFAAAGLERINLRPQNSIELNWMLPAPAQGAIMVVCRTADDFCFSSCQPLHDKKTDLCTMIERDFLHGLKGGCSTPISALAEIIDDQILFKGNLCGIDGKDIIDVERAMDLYNEDSKNIGELEAEKLLSNTLASSIMEKIRNGK